jgi:hypothetical protein
MRPTGESIGLTAEEQDLAEEVLVAMARITSVDITGDNNLVNTSQNIARLYSESKVSGSIIPMLIS